MLTGEEIRDWHRDDACGALIEMVTDAMSAKAHLDEITAKLGRRECQETALIAGAVEKIDALLRLLGAAAEDGAKAPDFSHVPEPNRSFFTGSQWSPEDIEKMRAAAVAPAQFNKMRAVMAAYAEKDGEQ
ncbi:hypothetical protein DWF04_005910 [Cereibacter sphaeroides f. sp. denitrificans]